MDPPFPTVKLWITGIDPSTFYQKGGLNLNSTEILVWGPKSFTVSVTESDAVIIKSWNGEIIFDYVKGDFQIISVSRMTIPGISTIEELKSILGCFDGCVVRVKMIGPAPNLDPGPGYDQGWDIVGANPDYVMIRTQVYEKVVLFKWEWFLRNAKKFSLVENRMNMPTIFSPREVKTERMRNLIRNFDRTPREWRLVGSYIWKIPITLIPQLKVMVCSVGGFQKHLVDGNEIDLATFRMDANVRKLILDQMTHSKILKKLDLLAWAIDTLIAVGVVEV